MEELNALLTQLSEVEELKFIQMCEEIGHEPISTFWPDFSIAEAFGDAAVRDTYKRAAKEWADDVEYMGELTLVLNWKIWELYKSDPKMAQLYDELWTEHEDYCWGKFAGDDAQRYFEITD